MADRILVPYDGSPQSRAALELAFEEFPDADVTALYVAEVPEGYWAQAIGPELQLPVSERVEEYGEEVLDSAQEIATAYDRSLRTEFATGEPDNRIVAHAEDEPIDLIVIGSHGQEGLARFLLGSVAETVVRRSPVSVLVVR